MNLLKITTPWSDVNSKIKTCEKQYGDFEWRSYHTVQQALDDGWRLIGPPGVEEVGAFTKMISRFQWWLTK